MRLCTNSLNLNYCNATDCVLHIHIFKTSRRVAACLMSLSLLQYVVDGILREVTEMLAGVHTFEYCTHVGGLFCWCWDS